jgi:hypothetical protein
MATLSADTRETAVRATAAQLGLEITAEQLPAVVRYCGLAAMMAEQVMGLPLTPADEPATVFVPVVPQGGGA